MSISTLVSINGFWFRFISLTPRFSTIIMYVAFATLSYYLMFDKRTLKHPKFLKNQIWQEIKMTNTSMPIAAIFYAPIILLEVRGYSRLYDTTDDGPGWWYNILQVPLFSLFSELYVYGIHRLLHHPIAYKHIHKSHHKWIVPTPFASHAFHPIDALLHSLQFRIFPFIFPLQKVVHIVLFVFANFFSIVVHDVNFIPNNPIVLSSASHAIHHSDFVVNFGQYSTIFDRLGGTYRSPEGNDKRTCGSEEGENKKQK